MNKDQKPGFSLNKGYPYAGIESQKQLPIRVSIVLEKDNVITLHRKDFPEPELTEANGFDEKNALIDFLMSRCFDFQEALKTAEQQLAEIFEDDPFIPEDLGFELAHKPETVSDAPIRVYSSVYDDRFTLHREIGNPDDPEWDTTKWVVMKKQDDTDKFDKVNVRIHNHRIAYHLFFALGVKMEAEQGPGEEAPVTEESPS